MNRLFDFQIAIAGSTWLFTYAMHSLVTHATALVSGRYLVRSPRFRSTLYRAALVLPLLTATALTAGIRPFAPIADINVADLTRKQTDDKHVAVFVEQRVLRTTSGVSKVDSFATDSHALNIAFVAAALAVLAALFGLVRLLHRELAFRRRVGPRMISPAHEGERGSAYQLTMSPTLGAPVALGLHEICVPEKTFSLLQPDERRSVLAHEAAHLARRDPFWFAASDALVALFPWQPLARMLARETRRTAEFCCDDAVVDTVGHGRALVRSLATFAEGFDPAETALAASCGGSPLEERARRLLVPAAPEIRHTGRWAAALALLLLVTMVSLAPAVSTRTKPGRVPDDHLRRLVMQEIDSIR